MAAFPQHSGAGARSVPTNRARDAAFASLSRELRLCLGTDGCVSHLGGAWHTLGYEPRGLRGVHWTTLVATRDHPMMRVAIERLLGSGEAQPELELEMRAGDGAPRLVHWTLARDRDAEGIVAVGYERADQDRAVAEARDTAARLERRVGELEALVEDLGEHSRAMEGFAAIAAHQLSEPLIVAESGTIMIAEELGDTLDPDLRARLDGIGRGAARARRLIDALLLDARTNSAPVELVAVDVERVVMRVLDCMRARMDERGAVAEVGPLPAVRAEPRLLEVIYENLLSNAVKYGARSGGSIEIAAERRGDEWRLSVTSGGVPLAGDDTTRVFEPFRRRPGERRAPGSGLGLAICARLVGRLGGTIGVKPQPAGNTFYFDLPAA
jgi:signal transduction histidine kinase